MLPPFRQIIPGAIAIFFPGLHMTQHGTDSTLYFIETGIIFTPASLSRSDGFPFGAEQGCSALFYYPSCRQRFSDIPVEMSGATEAVSPSPGHRFLSLVNFLRCFSPTNRQLPAFIIRSPTFILLKNVISLLWRILLLYFTILRGLLFKIQVRRDYTWRSYRIAGNL